MKAVLYMRKELNLFKIGSYIGWKQDLFKDPWMKLGGCGAVTACDSCIYFARRFGWTHLYPFDCNNLSAQDYIRFSKIMKPFLSPRINGIDTLEIYTDGFYDYLRSVNDNKISMKALYSDAPFEELRDAALSRMDRDIPVPVLLLKHKSPNFSDFEWHWFWLGGYTEFAGSVMVKVITYGTYYWMDFREMMDSGYNKKGGLILYN